MQAFGSWICREDESSKLRSQICKWVIGRKVINPISGATGYMTHSVFNDMFANLTTGQRHTIHINT